VEKFEKHFLDGLIQTVGEVKGGALEKIDKLIRHNAAFAYYNPELCVSFITLAAELVGAHDGIEAEIKRVYKKYRGFLLKLILQGKKEKIFRKEFDATLAALVIMAFHDGILLHWYMNRDKVDGESLNKTFRKMILDGLKI